ncbi:hypothetical protein ACWC9H_35395 [Streptomyces sp. NPDC001251]
MGDPYPGKIKYEGGTKKQLTWEQTVASVALGGWPESLWVKAAAVIDAESSRIANIYNTYLDGHYGLMQIGKQQHPEYFKSDMLWVVPFLNCTWGYAIYKSQGWGAWESASNGRYSGGLIQATAAVNSVKAKRAKTKLTPGNFYLSLYGADEDGWVLMAGAGGLGAINQSIGQSAGAAAGEINQTAQDAGVGVAQAAADIQANSFFGTFTLLLGAGKWMADPANWLRVAQVLAGGALLIGGVAIVAKPVTNLTPMGLAKKAVGK